MLSVGMLLKKSMKGELDLMNVIMKVVEQMTEGKDTILENPVNALTEDLSR